MINTLRHGIIVEVILIFAFASAKPATAQSLDYQPKVLLVTAHPDDDALFSVTVFKTARLLDGSVDLALITNGEGGYTYSTLGNYIYGKQLDKEEIGRAQLPAIRKKELMAGGDIVGMRNYFFFDQEDKEYSLDPKVPLASWNTDYIQNRLQKIIKKEQYDFVFTMMPSEETHAHHKASAILALRAVKALPPEDRPLVLSTTILRQKTDTTNFSGLDGYPITKIDRSINPFTFDRTQKFGNEDRLDYRIIANWVIAEHKSQGTMQLLMNAGKVEQYWYYALNPADEADKVREYFKAVNEVPIYTGPN